MRECQRGNASKAIDRCITAKAIDRCITAKAIARCITNASHYFLHWFHANNVCERNRNQTM